MPNSIPIKRAATIGTKLVRRLKADEKKLFITNIMTWKKKKNILDLFNRKVTYHPHD